MVPRPARAVGAAAQPPGGRIPRPGGSPCVRGGRGGDEGPLCADPAKGPGADAGDGVLCPERGSDGARCGESLAAAPVPRRCPQGFPGTGVHRGPGGQGGQRPTGLLLPEGRRRDSCVDRCLDGHRRRTCDRIPRRSQPDLRQDPDRVPARPHRRSRARPPAEPDPGRRCSCLPGRWKGRCRTFPGPGEGGAAGSRRPSADYGLCDAEYRSGVAVDRPAQPIDGVPRTHDLDRGSAHPDPSRAVRGWEARALGGVRFSVGTSRRSSFRPPYPDRGDPSVDPRPEHTATVRGCVPGRRG